MKRRTSLLIAAMELCRLRGAGRAVFLPPPDRRITPPPDDMSVMSSRTKKTINTAKNIPTSPRVEIKTGPKATQPHGPQAPHSPVSPTVTRVPRSTIDPQVPRSGTRRKPSALPCPILCPRPYETLYTEQAYVTTLLQEQRKRAASLIGDYHQIDAQLRDIDSSKERRQLRKHQSLLTLRSNEIWEQYRANSIRHGELSLEILSRDTWREVQEQAKRSSNSQHISQDGQIPDPASPSYFLATRFLTSGDGDMLKPSLNGASPDFIPRQGTDHWCTLPRTALSTTETSTSDEGTIIGLETVDEAAEYSSNQGLDYEFCGVDDDSDDVKSERRKSWNETAVSPQDKRLSLPNLQSLWQEYDES